ncbi:MAG: DivIVA domain-containing protein [Coprobacillus sp.]|nr:DivIVA domain-containing protein [Coprobacillus sp.]
MKKDLSLTSDAILNKVFSEAEHGYNALEVDEFLDLVLDDYRHLEKCQIVATEEYEKLVRDVEALKQQCATQTLEIERYKSRLKGIKESDAVSRENLDLVSRIRVLEKVLYDQGIDPTSIK